MSILQGTIDHAAHQGQQLVGTAEHAGEQLAAAATEDGKQLVDQGEQAGERLVAISLADLSEFAQAMLELATRYKVTFTFTLEPK